MTSSPVYMLRLSDFTCLEYAQHQDTGRWYEREVYKGVCRKWHLAKSHLIMTPSEDGKTLEIDYRKSNDGSPVIRSATRTARTYARLPRKGVGATVAPLDEGLV